MSIVIVALDGAPTPNDEAKQKEAELDSRLEEKIKEILDHSEPPDAPLLSYVTHLLASQNIEGLPPGGGLCAKRTTIEQILNRLCPTKNDSE
jgi:hypothetical protein